MVADRAQHGFAIGGKPGERAQQIGHLGRGGIGRTGHHRGDGSGNGATLGRIVTQPASHHQRTQIGIAEAEGTVLIGEFGDPARRVLRHHHGDLEHHGPQPGGVFEACDVDRAIRLAEPHQVQRRQITRRIVEEHVFRARVGCIDPSRRRAGVPVVDGGVELHAGIGRVPGRLGDTLPEGGGADGLRHLAGRALGQRPVAIAFDRPKEFVGDTHRVVGVLARDRCVGLRLPVGVEGRKLEVAITLTGELNGALDVVFRQLGLAGVDDGASQPDVPLRIERTVALVVEAGLHDRIEMPAGQPRSRHQRGDLLLLEHLPGDELLDVGVVDIDGHHLGGAPRRAARLDGAGGAIAHLEEGHEPRRLAAARQLLARAAQPGEVGAGTGAILEEARFADPEVHDTALVHQIVGNALDEAGMRLRALIGGGGGMGAAVAMIDVPVALTWAVDAVRPMQPGVEPLRRVGRADLRCQHEAELVVEGAGVLFAVEVTALPAPVGPGAGHAMEHLAGAGFAAKALVDGQCRQRLPVGSRTPQPFRHVALGELDQMPRHAGATEVLLGEHIGGDRRPFRRHFDVALTKYDRAVGIADLGIASTKRHPFEWRMSCSRIPTVQTHRRSPVPNSRHFIPSRGVLGRSEHADMGT